MAPSTGLRAPSHIDSLPITRQRKASTEPPGHIAKKACLSFDPSRFRVLDLPAELRLMVLQSALTLDKVLAYTCPHRHSSFPYEDIDTWLDDCTHRDDDSCDHERSRPSETPSKDGRYIFWLPMIANRQLFAETAFMLPRYNTIAFTHETMQCFHASQSDGPHDDASVDRRMAAVREIRAVDIALDFTWVAALAEHLAGMEKIEEVTLTATSAWLQPMMLWDFLALMGRLPTLNRFRVVVEAQNVAECSWCAGCPCDIWRNMLNSATRTAQIINARMERALRQRAQRRKARYFKRENATVNLV